MILFLVLVWGHILSHFIVSRAGPDADRMAGMDGDRMAGMDGVVQRYRHRQSNKGQTDKFDKLEFYQGLVKVGRDQPFPQ